MKIGNILKLRLLVCINIMAGVLNFLFTTDNGLPGNVTIAGVVDNFSRPGYRPVSDTCPYVDGEDKLNDNFLYKEWCEETFVNGNYIYDAYKDIAFNIEYTPEVSKTDFWQTPVETARLKKGDCEDAVFLFFSQLPSDQENAEIVWGWVINKRSAIGRAHVWYQLIDKKGKKYVVEGFYKDWNGIIPMEIIEETESRRPIFKMPHSAVGKLAILLSEADEQQIYQYVEDQMAAANSDNYDIRHGESDKGVTRNPAERGKQLYLHMDTLSSCEDIARTANKRLPERNRVGDHLQGYTQYRGDSTGFQILPDVSKEISNIFEKLQRLFFRYERQKREIDKAELGSSIQVATISSGSIELAEELPKNHRDSQLEGIQVDAISFYPGENLRCRR